MHVRRANYPLVRAPGERTALRSDAQHIALCRLPPQQAPTDARVLAPQPQPVSVPITREGELERLSAETSQGGEFERLCADTFSAVMRHPKFSVSALRETLDVAARLCSRPQQRKCATQILHPDSPVHTTRLSLEKLADALRRAAGSWCEGVAALTPTAGTPRDLAPVSAQTPPCHTYRP